MKDLLKLLWTLGKNIPHSLTIRQLAKEAIVPYTTAYRAINKNKKLFRVMRKGNIKLCSLNLENPIAKSYLTLAESQQAENFLKKDKKLSIIKNELPKGNYTCLLFGSRADENHREKSDIDLAVMNREGSRNIGFSKYELLFKLEINPIFLSKKEFIGMLREKEHNLAHEIIKKHIILHGEEYFWDMILKIGKSLDFPD